MLEYALNYYILFWLMLHSQLSNKFVLVNLFIKLEFVDAWFCVSKNKTLKAIMYLWCSCFLVDNLVRNKSGYLATISFVRMKPMYFRQFPNHISTIH